MYDSLYDETLCVLLLARYPNMSQSSLDFHEQNHLRLWRTKPFSALIQSDRAQRISRQQEEADFKQRQRALLVRDEQRTVIDIHVVIVLVLSVIAVVIYITFGYCSNNKLPPHYE